MFPVADGVEVGFIVIVGSIWGGLYAKNMGFMGLPSNLYRSRRVNLVYGSE